MISCKQMFDLTSGVQFTSDAFIESIGLVRARIWFIDTNLIHNSPQYTMASVLIDADTQSSGYVCMQI